LSSGERYVTLDGMAFTTLDQDHDRFSDGLCGQGGWWYNYCGYVRLTLDYNESVMWVPFSYHNIYVDMKIKLN